MQEQPLERNRHWKRNNNRSRSNHISGCEIAPMMQTLTEALKGSPIMKWIGISTAGIGSGWAILQYWIVSTTNNNKKNVEENKKVIAEQGVTLAVICSRQASMETKIDKLLFLHLNGNKKQGDT